MEIWGLEAERFKEAELESIETLGYVDLSEQKWVMHRTKGGIFFGYFGEQWRTPTHFEVFVEGTVQYNNVYMSGEVDVKNNGFFYVDTSDFNDFLELRSMFMKNTNREVWKAIGMLFHDRLSFDSHLLDCEVVKKYR